MLRAAHGHIAAAQFERRADATRCPPNVGTPSPVFGELRPLGRQRQDTREVRYPGTRVHHPLPQR
jgi:hypothetical protein